MGTHQGPEAVVTLQCRGSLNWGTHKGSLCGLYWRKVGQAVPFPVCCVPTGSLLLSLGALVVGSMLDFVRLQPLTVSHELIREMGFSPLSGTIPGPEQSSPQDR